MPARANEAASRPWPSFGTVARYGWRRTKRLLLAPVRKALLAYARAEPSPQALEQAHRRVFIYLVSAWGMGGTIRTVHNMAGHLAKKYDVEILSVFRRREEPFFAFPDGVKVTALDDERPGATPRRLRLLRAVLRRFPGVLVHPADRGAPHCNLWVDLMLVRRLRKQAGVFMGTRPGLNLAAADLALPGFKVIGQEHMHFSSHSRPLRRAMRRRYGRLDALTVLTEEDLLEYQKILAGGPPIVRIPNSVAPMAGPNADLAAKTVLAAGRLTPQKGFDMLIEAWALVARERSDWRLRICGRGERHQEYLDLVARHGLSDVIELPGPRDLEEEIANSSIFVLSSRYEGFPLVLIEAMSKGMAVVAFDCPTGPGDIVEDGRNGLLIPARDVERLAQGIITMMNDEELRRTCAAAAIETAKSYSLDVVGAQWERLLETVADGRPQVAVAAEAK